jgi:hypothetical protein
MNVFTSHHTPAGTWMAALGLAFACGVLAAPTVAHAQATPPLAVVGSLSNFDVINDTEHETEGFEIQLEGIHKEDLTRVFGESVAGLCYTRYCAPTVTENANGVFVRWAAIWDPVTQQFTTRFNAPGVSVTPGTPPSLLTFISGEQCWVLGLAAAYPTSGCEHFGISSLRNPTNTTYRWLVADPNNPGALIPDAGGVPVNIPSPTVVLVPAAKPDVPPDVAVEIKAPSPAHGLLSGDAQWVKVFKTEIARKVDLDELIGGNPVVPADAGSTETSWKLLQNNPRSGKPGFLLNQKQIQNGSHAVIRRYEFYKFTGPYDPSDHDAICQDGTCSAPSAGELGPMIGAQMGAANLDVPQVSPIITWLSPAKINVGTPLGPAQLNAVANVPGTFTYNPPAGTILPIGANQQLNVTFTPDDTTKYLTAIESAFITVVPAVAAVSNDFVLPNAGSGAVQNFSLQYSDTDGAADLSTEWVWFKGSSSTASSCVVAYDSTSSTLFLLNDAGTAWKLAPIGSSGALQNNQCAIALGGSSSATLNNSSVTLFLSMTFGSTFNGAKTLDMYTENATGSRTGWQTRGAWTVANGVSFAAPPAVSVDSVSPSAGSGGSQTFTMKYSDTVGASDLSTAWIWFKSAATTANSCIVAYDRAATTVFLLNDAGTVWNVAPIGSAGNLQNSQCVIALGGSTTATLSGNTLTVNLAVTFGSGFNGAKNIDMYTENSSGANTGWQTRGAYTVAAAAPVAAPAVVTADAVSPSAGAGSSQSFALQFSDTAGAADLSTAWVWFKNAATTANACIVYYDRASTQLFLLNDAGTRWIVAPIASNGSLANSQCSVALGGSTTAVIAGPSLSLNLAMTFTPAFNGAKSIDMYTENSTGARTGWQTRGGWTVQ